MPEPSQACRWWDIPGQILHKQWHLADNAVWMLLQRRARRGAFRPLIFFAVVALGTAACLNPILLWPPYIFCLFGVFAGSVAPALRFGSGRGWGGSADQQLLVACTDSEFAEPHESMLTCALLYTVSLALTVTIARLAMIIAARVAWMLLWAEFGELPFGELAVTLFSPELVLLFMLSLLGWAFYWIALRHGMARSALTLVAVLILAGLPGLPVAAFLYLALPVFVAVYVGRCRRAVQDGYIALLADKLDAGGM